MYDPEKLWVVSQHYLTTYVLIHLLTALVKDRQTNWIVLIIGVYFKMRWVSGQYSSNGSIFDELKRIWKERSWINRGYIGALAWRDWEEQRRNLSHNDRCHSRDPDVIHLVVDLDRPHLQPQRLNVSFKMLCVVIVRYMKKNRNKAQHVPHEEHISYLNSRTWPWCVLYSIAKWKIKTLLYLKWEIKD
jgi:hypothetical protein